MGRQSVFGHFVHALGSDLHFHPFVFRTSYGDVQALVAVAFWNSHPVAQAFQVWLIVARDEREYVPAVLQFLRARRVEDDADGKEVVNAIESALLLLHLLPDGMDALRASLDMVA